MIISVGRLQGFKLELSYGLVDRTSLHWLPAVDELLTSYCGERVRCVVHGNALWNNRGPRHSIGVASRQGLAGLAEASALFAEETRTLAELAVGLGGRLMPTGMHPWMPASRAESWPHGTPPEDRALASLFRTERHGYANQQALRLSIPFAGDAEFARVFAALRFVMPLIPALAASSPFAEGKQGQAMSCRIASRRDFYSAHEDFSDSLIPRSSTCREEYLGEVLNPIERSLERCGQSSSLRSLDLCANGIVADFDAGLVHVEVLDMQECLQSNLAVCAAVAAVSALVQIEEFAPLAQLGSWPRARLGELLELTLLSAEHAVFRDSEFTKAFGFPECGACRASELWQFLIEEACSENAMVQASAGPLQRITTRGSLARRMLRELPARFSDEDLFNLYREICNRHDRDELL